MTTDDNDNELPICPWCDRPQTIDEIRRCSGYRPRGYTDDELRDAYSDPTDRAKKRHNEGLCLHQSSIRGNR